ncbi:MAG TPA: DUF4091 domain-containing protein [Thermoguttaceae bacterium]|nr:DUF4091 domain-containing protein [Thermoguttaceae bacterium]
MLRSLTIPFVAISLAAAGQQAAAQVTLARVDALDRVYPDRAPPDFTDIGPVSVAREGSIAFQFAAVSQQDVSCRMNVGVIARDDGVPLAGRVATYRLLPVHVEGNTQGSLKNRPGGEVPEGWMKSLIRPAPFDVMEVLVEADRVELAAGRSQAMLVDVEVAPEASPGRYTGRFELRLAQETVSVPFSLLVHQTILPPTHKLHSVHWFWPMPENLTDGDPPPWWSDRHWELIESSARQLRRFGDDTVLTPLVDGREPLIRVSRDEREDYAFDYARFDRWVETFLRLGFNTFAGRHVVSMGREVWVLDRSSGAIEPLLEKPNDREAWLRFLPVFYDSLFRHLEERKWTDRYLQHQYDEPKDPELYKRLVGLARRHMPGVRTIDAINSRPEAFSPLVDAHVFNLITLLRNAELADRRRAEDRAVWLYHCTSPYPPYPNRHLDRPLAECRLWPWICYRWRAEGFLYWAANLYRGADEYKTSIGPFPNGSQDPGHPPGDAWFYYRGPDGLRPSMRIVAFRSGLVDHTLLTMLAEKDGKLAEEIAREVVPSATEYRTDPAVYHNARRRILAALDGEPAP